MVEQDSAQTLVESAQRGDRAAFERLVDAYEGRLRLFVRSRVKLHIGPALDTDEVIQESFLRAYEVIRRFQWDGEGSFFRWLCGIAKHVLMKTAERSRKIKYERLDSALEMAASGESPSKGLRRDERLNHLQGAIDELPPDYKRVLRLARIEGLKIAEIAERLDRSADSVKHLLRRALAKLRKSLGETESLNLSDRRLAFLEIDDVEG